MVAHLWLDPRGREWWACVSCRSQTKVVRMNETAAGNAEAALELWGSLTVRFGSGAPEQ